MSGLEVAGVLLGAFPLIISGLEHWRDVAKVGGFFRQIRKAYTACRSDVEYYGILYKRNLKGLLLPIVNDADEVTRLVDDPGGKGWSSNVLQERLERRLQESYNLYMEIIYEMNNTVEKLQKELGLDKTSVKSKLAPPQEPKKQPRPTSPQPPSNSSRFKSAKSKADYDKFRLKFSFNEPVRKELFEQLKECNGRLEKLLQTSDNISVLEIEFPANKKHDSALETLFKKAWEKSDLLFKAIQKSWQCSCLQHHHANLRLEHRTLPEICFEVILISSSSRATTPWSWRELQCRQMSSCSCLQKLMKPSTVPQSSQRWRNDTLAPTAPHQSARTKKVTFTASALTVPRIELDTMVDPGVKLCQLLGNENHGNCFGIISHDDEMYHLHPITEKKRPKNSGPLTLDHVLSSEESITRRQRYYIALLLASSVAQLQFTPWLQNSLTKENVLFFPCADGERSVLYQEPFIRQGFGTHRLTDLPTKANICNFSSLGILLLELCFGRRLDDHPLRKKHPAETGEAKQAFDLMAALKWSQEVRDEGGDDFASAVKWCFLTGTKDRNRSWRGEIIENVIRPLEQCQEHFKAVAML